MPDTAAGLSGLEKALTPLLAAQYDRLQLRRV
jgi:hypothetical protein